MAEPITSFLTIDRCDPIGLFRPSVYLVQVVSGFKINSRKCEIMPVGDVEDIHQFPGSKLQGWGSPNYLLGLPLGASRSLGVESRSSGVTGGRKDACPKAGRKCLSRAYYQISSLISFLWFMLYLQSQKVGKDPKKFPLGRGGWGKEVPLGVVEACHVSQKVNVFVERVNSPQIWGYGREWKSRNVYAFWEGS